MPGLSFSISALLAALVGKRRAEHATPPASFVTSAPESDGRLARCGAQGSGQAEAAPAATPEAIDISRILLVTGGDMEEEQMLAGLFLKCADESLGVLKNHLDGSAGAADWRAAAHRLKGAAAEIGASRLAAACLYAEVGFESAAEEKQPLVAKIENLLRDVDAYFAARAAAMPAVKEAGQFR